MSLDELITAATRLNETDLDELVQQVVALRTHRKAHVLPSFESQFLDQINQSVPLELRTQYDELRAKREAETLIEEEQGQLIELSQRIEQFGADRLEAMVNLAQLRQVSLAKLMESLGIQTVSYKSVSKPLPLPEAASARSKKQQAIAQSQAIDELITETEVLGLYE